MDIQRQNILDKFNKELKSIEKSNDSNKKMTFYYNIIPLFYFNNLRNDIYVYCKKFIVNYIETLENNNYEYDRFDVKKIIKLISYLDEKKSQLEILKYLSNKLNKEQIRFESEILNKEIILLEIKILKDNFSKKNIINFEYYRIIYLIIIKKYKHLLLLFLLIFGVVIIFTLPAPIDTFAVFRIRYIDYSNLSWLNHILNILSLFADLSNGCQIIPKNLLGLLIIIISKVLFITFIIKFVYYKFSEKFEIK